LTKLPPYRVHTAGTYQAKPAGVAYGAGKFPAACPNHTGLYNGVADGEKICNSFLAQFVYYWIKLKKLNAKDYVEHK
jgi:hypothetical protein